MTKPEVGDVLYIGYTKTCKVERFTVGQVGSDGWWWDSCGGWHRMARHEWDGYTDACTTRPEAVQQLREQYQHTRNELAARIAEVDAKIARVVILEQEATK